MATTPLSQDLVDKLTRATAWRFNNKLGQTFTPRFFCCSDPNEMGIVDGKEPVAVLELSPNPAFPGDTISFDGTNSYDPDGSIVGYAWTFGGGTPSSSSSGSGTVSWASVGEYEVKLIVTDGTGKKSSPARVVMVIKDPNGAYFIATSTGVYFTEDGGQNWVAKNTGLAGDALTVNDIKVDPATQHLSHGEKTLWIATDDGPYVSNDGGDTWTQKLPASVSDIWGDTPAPTPGGLTFEKLLFVEGRLFVVANWQNSGGDERGWIFYTDDTEAVRSDGSAAVSWSEL